jgi:hypothetical protein
MIEAQNSIIAPFANFDRRVAFSCHSETAILSSNLFIARAALSITALRTLSRLCAPYHRCGAPYHIRALRKTAARFRTGIDALSWPSTAHTPKTVHADHFSFAGRILALQLIPCNPLPRPSLLFLTRIPLHRYAALHLATWQSHDDQSGDIRQALCRTPAMPPGTGTPHRSAVDSSYATGTVPAYVPSIEEADKCPWPDRGAPDNLKTRASLAAS